MIPVDIQHNEDTVGGKRYSMETKYSDHIEL